MPYLRPEEEIRLLAGMVSTATKVAAEQFLKPSAKARKDVKEARLLLMAVAKRCKINSGSIEDILICSKKDIEQANVHVETDEKLNPKAQTIVDAFNMSKSTPPPKRVDIRKVRDSITASFEVTVEELQGRDLTLSKREKLVSKLRRVLMIIGVDVLGKEVDDLALFLPVFGETSLHKLLVCARMSMRKDGDFQRMVQDLCGELQLPVPAY